MTSNPRDALDQERDELLRRIEAWLEGPMMVLGFLWLAFLILELTRGVSPWIETATTVIWVVFLVDFALRFLLAPHKSAYLKGNWLTALSLAAPALRVLRVARVVRALRVARGARSLRLLKLFGSVNRGMRALGVVMRRRGFGYVVVLTVLVAVAGAAGIFYFERGPGLPDFGTALWWTAMILTTMGSEYWPQTPEGRILSLVLSLYAFATFGYVTATLASYFVGRDAEDPEAEIGGAPLVLELQREIAALREEIRALSEGLADRSR